MSDIFFTADTHFGHTNIIKYCNRPFASTEEHDEALIANWNACIPQNAHVYHLGDFAWKSKDIPALVSALHGQIHIICGNHDRSLHAHRGLFASYRQAHYLKVPAHIHLSHFAHRVWSNSHRNAWHLFGHSHGTLPGVGKSYDVGVDNNNFTPVSLAEITSIMSTRLDNEGCLPEFRGT